MYSCSRKKADFYISSECIKYHNLDSLKEWMTLLCKSILETKQISCWYSLALFLYKNTLLNSPYYFSAPAQNYLHVIKEKRREFFSYSRMLLKTSSLLFPVSIFLNTLMRKLWITQLINLQFQYFFFLSLSRRPTLSHWRGKNFTHTELITAYLFQVKVNVSLVTRFKSLVSVT